MSGGQCINCHGSCAKCSNYGNDNCQECISPNFLSNTTCSPSCPPATFQNLLNRKCDPCTSPCIVCTNASQCSSCSAGFKLISGQCNGDTYFTTNSTAYPSLPINTANIAALPSILNAFTFESWFQSTENSPSNSNSIAFGLNPWKFKRNTISQVYNLVYKNTLSFCLTDNLPGNVWYHFAFSFDQKNGLQCYISGRNQTVGTAD